MSFQLPDRGRLGSFTWKCAPLRARFVHFRTFGAHALRGLGTKPQGTYAVRCDAVLMQRHSVINVTRIISVSITAILPVAQGIGKAFDVTLGPSDRLAGWEPYSREFTDCGNY